MARIISGISLAAVMSVLLLVAACPVGGAESGVNVKKKAVAAVEVVNSHRKLTLILIEN